MLWKNQLGTATWDIGLSVYYANDETLIVGADTYGDLGARHVKARDVAVFWMDPDTGAVRDSSQFGSVSHDFGNDITGDDIGNAYVAGIVGNELVPGKAQGAFDGFVIKLAGPFGSTSK